jgi:hypothetical protein
MIYPGFGPWSHLPPWKRPGWKFGWGRDWCWRYLMSKRVSRKDELRMLEEEAERLERMLNEVRKRIDELRK